MDLVELVPAHAQGDVTLLRGKDRASLLPWTRLAGEGSSIGLVPTMGYLHEGHLSLLRAARAECDVVVMSLFVNPTQFGPGEDLDRYPRDEERDLRLAAEAGVDFVYAPPVEEVYPEGFATYVEVEGSLTERARRRSRDAAGPSTSAASPPSSPSSSTRSGPTSPTSARRTPSRLAVIRRMVSDLDFPLRIEVLPTVREPDGLAMSSRNAYLEPSERRRATALSRALAAAEATRSRGGALRRARSGRCRAERRRDRARVPRGARRRRPLPGRRAGQRGRC